MTDSRVLAAVYPDWPVTAAGAGPADLAAITTGNRITGCTAAARARGVRIGQRRRQAQLCCPDLRLFPHDPRRDTSGFEPVVAALTQLTPRVEIAQPGICVLPASGAIRYYGGEARLRALLADAARSALRQAGGIPAAEVPQPAIGIADSRFAAVLASRRGHTVPPGQTAAFLAEFSIAELSTQLDLPELATLLRRLGIRSLGEFAALPAAAVMSRFGKAAAEAHRLARGQQPEPLALQGAIEQLRVACELDPPAEQVEMAAFAARPLAEDLLGLLSRRGLACTRVRIEAETEHGEVQYRLWRALETFDSDTIAQRVRWQLAGWLEDSGAARPTAGITVLRLFADEVASTADLQLGLWGQMSETDRRASRGLDRVRGLLGPRAILTGLIRGGRAPAERVQLVPWGEPATGPDDGSQPWPGRLPAPSPALVHSAPERITVVSAQGAPVAVDGRGQLTTAPARMQLAGGRWHQITAWAGPWLADERWWDPDAHRRLARFQLLTAECGNQTGYLCVVEGSQWFLEATYD